MQTYFSILLDVYGRFLIHMMNGAWNVLTVPVLFLLCRSEYAAEPADIWSCGMVLLAMLTGELPWDQPTSDQVGPFSPKGSVPSMGFFVWDFHGIMFT